MGDVFTFSSTVFKRLYARYVEGINNEQFFGKARTNTHPPRILRPNQFKTLLKSAFWASYKHEESRFHNFSLALIPKEACYHPFIFDETAPFDEGHIAKLAPAFDPLFDFIGLWLGETNSISMWGFASVQELERLKPDYRNAYLFCEAIGPGQLLLSSAHRDLGVVFFSALISGTSLEFLEGNEFFYWVMPNSKGKRIIDWSLSEITQASDYRLIAKAMRLHQHGGILLIVPENSEWTTSIRHPISYGGQGYKRIARDILTRNKIADEEFKQIRLSPSPRYEVGVESAKKSLNVIGKLTAIDGATLITENFNVLALGAKIEAKSKPDTILTSTPFLGSLPKEEPLSALGGTRHQSAAQFVYEQKRAVAIVASQDGKISIMRWDSEKELVCILRPAEFVL